MEPETTVTDTPQAPEKPRRPRRTRFRLLLQVERLALLAALLGFWEWGSGRLFDPFFASRPSDIAEAWWDLATNGELWSNAASTFQSAALGFLIGGSCAIVVGYVLGSSQRLSLLLEPFITGIYSIPKLALIPLFVMWFGTGRQLQAVISGIVVFFLMFFNTFYGVRDVSQGLIDAMRIMGANRWALAFQVRLPSALVWVVAGLKLSVPQCLIAVVVAEMFSATHGLGHLVTLFASQYSTAYTFAAIFTLLAIGLLIDRGVSVVTGRALRWKEGGTTS
ncbi:ABC transporter permease [Streptomyces sp. NPDC055078]